MSTLKITIVQADLHWHDPAQNLKRFSAALDAYEEETDLFVLPEMFATGFTMHAEDYAEPMDGSSVEWMARTANRLGAAICGSLIIKDGGKHFNRFVLVEPDGTLSTYDKRHRFRLAGEHEHYSAGDKRTTIDLKGWRIRPMVCYDLRFPVWSRNADDYDLLLYVANWPDRRHLAWETLIRARAIENLCYVAAVNRVGDDGNGIAYLGGSAIIDYLGNYLAVMSDEPGLRTATLRKESLEQFRERFPFHRDADGFSLTGRTGN